MDRKAFEANALRIAPDDQLTSREIRKSEAQVILRARDDFSFDIVSDTIRALNPECGQQASVPNLSLIRMCLYSRTVGLQIPREMVRVRGARHGWQHQKDCENHCVALLGKATNSKFNGLHFWMDLFCPDARYSV
jgi:hypothetical protein